MLDTLPPVTLRGLRLPSIANPGSHKPCTKSSKTSKHLGQPWKPALAAPEHPHMHEVVGLWIAQVVLSAKRRKRRPNQPCMSECWFCCLHLLLSSVLDDIPYPVHRLRALTRKPACSKDAHVCSAALTSKLPLTHTNTHLHSLPLPHNYHDPYESTSPVTLYPTSTSAPPAAQLQSSCISKHLAACCLMSCAHSGGDGHRSGWGGWRNSTAHA
mmetsp:Transcript_3339/g.8915  ORF Transcript_3339/g.8915 Transcript_3339/m.8915 type:complete len:213 (-) Transcript_3339:1138-1776(-)